MNIQAGYILGPRTTLTTHGHVLILDCGDWNELVGVFVSGDTYRIDTSQRELVLPLYRLLHGRGLVRYVGRDRGHPLWEIREPPCVVGGDT